VADRRSTEKTGYTFLSACGGAEKFSDLLSLWQLVVKLFSPGCRPDTTKIGRGHTGNELKRVAPPAPGIKFFCGPGQQVRGFLHQEHDISF
jgi:hypothetical protein